MKNNEQLRLNVDCSVNEWHYTAPHNLAVVSFVCAEIWSHYPQFAPITTMTGQDGEHAGGDSFWHLFDGGINVFAFKSNGFGLYISGDKTVLGYIETNYNQLRSLLRNRSVLSNDSFEQIRNGYDIK